MLNRVARVLREAIIFGYCLGIVLVAGYAMFRIGSFFNDVNDKLADLMRNLP